jgi:hypothetical protein
VGYLERRGLTVAEVEETIRGSSWETGERGRLEARKTFQFGRDWNGRRYVTKQVHVVFVEEENEVVVVTVYTYFIGKGG